MAKQMKNKLINEKRNNVSKCNLLLMRNLSLHIGHYEIKSRLDRRQAHTQRNVKSVHFPVVINRHSRHSTGIVGIVQA